MKTLDLNLTFVSLCILFTFIFIFIFLFRRQRVPSPTNPLSPPKLPILGHLHLLTDMPHHALAKLASELGPIIHLQFLAETQALYAGFNVADFYPGLEWVNSVTGLKRRLLRNLEDLRRVCDEIIGEHVQRKNDVSDKEDFVHVLLRVQKSDDLEVPITDDNLKAFVLHEVL